MQLRPKCKSLCMHYDPKVLLQLEPFQEIEHTATRECSADLKITSMQDSTNVNVTLA